MGKVAGSGPNNGCTDFYSASIAKGEMPVKEVTAGQLDLPSLTSLSIAGYGPLQLGVAYWAISVALLQVVDNWSR